LASAFVISAAAIICGIFKYESLLGGGPIHTASSANLTCRLSASAVEYTATVLIPISLQVLITRKAISPLFAINIFLNIVQRKLKLKFQIPDTIFWNFSYLIIGFLVMKGLLKTKADQILQEKNHQPIL